ncbi:MAG: diguanylate cyclase [Candidatus Omnitrophota bacterium]
MMMKKSQNLDRPILIACFILSGIFFFVDLCIPWAVVGILYSAIIALSLWSSKKNVTINFAIFTSILVLTGIVMLPPHQQALRFYANHILVFALIWIMAFLGIKAKQSQEIKLYMSSIVESTNDAIWGVSLDGIITSWNESARNLFGYHAAEITGKSYQILFSEDKRGEFIPIRDIVKQDSLIRYYETTRLKKDGSIVQVSLTNSPIKDMQGSIIGVSVIARDISGRLLAEQKEKQLKHLLEVEKNKLEQVLKLEEGLHAVLNMDTLIDFVIKKTSKILESSRCSLMLYDEKTNDLCLKGHVGFSDNFDIPERKKLGDPIAGLIALEGKSVLVEDIEKDKRFSRRNMPYYQSKSFISAPLKLGDKLMGVLSVTNKQSEQTKIYNDLDLKILNMIVRHVAVAIEASHLYKELKFLTITDPLTGIYNFRHFAQSLDREINRARRYKRPLCLLMIDIDDFKTYNDTFGHLDGDILLKELSKLFSLHTRNVDIVSRYAGDEFVIILPDTDVADAECVAGKILANVGKLRLKQKATISIGLVKFGGQKDRYELMLKADTALYQAKKEGKNRIYKIG